jgi:peptide/nickel transport system permease protein
MVVIVAIGPSLDNLVLALVAVSWPGYARLIRGVTLTVKNNLYVEAARASGTKAGAILRRHILPNTVSPMMVQGTLDIGSVVLVAAGLSFIGFSFASPQTAEWGRMVYDGQQQLGASSFRVWWPVFFPGLAIFLFVLGFNMLGDGLRDVLDPRLRR